MLNKIYKNAFLIQILFLTGGAILFQLNRVKAQEIDIIETRFDQYRKNDLQEKLFVHTDKNFYLAGELIWFKIYDINGASNAPFDFSKVAYVELLNRQNQPVYQAKISLTDTGQGSIKIPLTLPTGNYRLRAYTAWMKNFSPDYYFKKEVTIINTTQQGGGVSLNGEEKYDVQFMPEGGNLVAGIKSEVGFRVVDQNGNGVDFKGVLLDDHKDSILTFRPFKFGIGNFYFTPSANDHYKAILLMPDGETIEKRLPEIYAKGYVMHLQKINGKVQITVKTNIADAGSVALIIHTRQSVKAAQVLTIQDGMASYMISENQLGDGISAFTVFNNVLQPVCERLFFKRVNKKLDIKIDPDQKAYGLRKKVSISFGTANEKHQPVAADMSVSVYRLDSLQRIGPDNILNYLWLTSDLKGKIQDPAYYFQTGQEEDQALDNLMLTQGWRRFNWNNVMDNKNPVISFAPETKKQIITARVKNKSGEPVAGILTYLGIPGKYNRVYGSQSDTNGFIYFGPRNLYGKHEIVLETNTQSRDSVYNIQPENPFTDEVSGGSVPAFTLDRANIPLLEMHNLWNQVQQSYHEKMLDSLKPLHIDSTAFYGKPYKVYHLDDYTRYTTMEEVMREYVTEVAVRKRAGHYHFQTMNALFNYDKTASAMLFQDDPLILLDGVPVFNVDSVMAIDPLKIEKLEVVAGRYFWGPIVADGIVSYTSYKGDMANFKLDPHALVIDYEGLQRQREYYSPVYDKKDTSSFRIPDFRNVLYWNPLLISDGDGKATCSFYSSDIPGRYIIVVNGITADGRAGYRVNFFEVRK